MKEKNITSTKFDSYISELKPEPEMIPNKSEDKLKTGFFQYTFKSIYKFVMNEYE